MLIWGSGLHLAARKSYTSRQKRDIGWGVKKGGSSSPRPIYRKEKELPKAKADPHFHAVFNMAYKTHIKISAFKDVAT